MESKRKNVYITIFVITTIIASCIAVYFGISENTGKKKIKELEAKVEVLNSTEEKDKETKVEGIGSTEEQNKEEKTGNIEIKETDSGTKNTTSNNELLQENIDKIARVTIEDYINLTRDMFSSGYGGLVGKYLNFYSSYDEYDKHTKYADANNTKVKTDIRYDDFMEKIEKYMTKELFEETLSKQFYANSEGNLEFVETGASGYINHVRNVELISKNSNEYEYKVEYSIYGMGGKNSDKSGKFKIKNVNGSYVVSDNINS